MKPSQFIGVQAVVAALAWGAAYAACDGYLRALDTSPAEVGLSINSVLISVGTVLLAFLPATWCAVGASMMLRRVRFIAAEVAFMGGALVFVGLISGMGRVVRYDPVVPVLLVLGVILVLLAFVESEAFDVPTWLATSLANLFAVYGVAIALVFALILSSAGRDASRIGSSGTPHGMTSLLGLHAQPVCVEPLDQAIKVLPTDRPLLLLGTNDGIAVLRDRAKQMTVRAPAAQFTMRSVSSTSSACI